MIILDDYDVNVGAFSYICLRCKHYTSEHKCAAFPERIPPEIWVGDNDHREPYPGDNGIQYEPIDGGDNGRD